MNQNQIPTIERKEDGSLPYEYYMILENTPDCLMPIRSRETYEYDLNNVTSLSGYLEHSPCSYYLCTRLFTDLKRAVENMREYMLDERYLILDPEYIYMKADYAFCFLYNVDYVGTKCEQLTEQVLPFLDYEDDTLIERMYELDRMTHIEEVSVSGFCALIGDLFPQVLETAGSQTQASENVAEEKNADSGQACIVEIEPLEVEEKQGWFHRFSPKQVLGRAGQWFREHLPHRLQRTEPEQALPETSFIEFQKDADEPGQSGRHRAILTAQAKEYDHDIYICGNGKLCAYDESEQGTELAFLYYYGRNWFIRIADRQACILINHKILRAGHNLKLGAGNIVSINGHIYNMKELAS